MMFRLFRSLSVLLAVAALLGGCATQSVRTTEPTPLQQATTDVEESQLLDVSLLLFDPGLEQLADDDLTTLPEIRKAEARFIPFKLADIMQYTGHWGAVRVIPRQLGVSDLVVSGKILASNGQEVSLQVTASDATGRQWFTRSYTSSASKYSYESRGRTDPFLDIYHRIANDLAEYCKGLSGKQLTEIRTIAEMAFASSFSPENFNDYLGTDNEGHRELLRLPSDEDPMLQRVRQIRERDYLFVDTVHEYYGGFVRRMKGPYDEWRKLSYEEVMAYEELKRESRWRTAAGVAAILAGIAAAGSDNGSVQQAGTVGVVGGGYLIKSAMDKRAEAEIHAEALSELGGSLSAEIAPQVIELEDRTVTLTGTVEDQYNQWREILKEIYRREHGDI